jgi:hypoxanthine-DNA glycosylase
VREGSADNKISDIIPNDIQGLLTDHPNISKILLNGRKTEAEYRRRFANTAPPAYYVPSTSPALASLTFEEKLRAWKRFIGE